MTREYLPVAVFLGEEHMLYAVRGVKDASDHAPARPLESREDHLLRSSKIRTTSSSRCLKMPWTALMRGQSWGNESLSSGKRISPTIALVSLCICHLN